MRLRFVLSLLVFGVVGCQAQPEVLTPHYLMLHPSLLKTKAAECEQQSLVAESDCPMITKTMEAFFALLLDQQREPEQFGQRILAAQQTYGQALARVALAEQALSQKKASGADVKAEALAYQNALAAADEAKANVDVLLVVVGESSPE